MMGKRLSPVALLILLVAPLTAFAQIRTGSVDTSPFVQAAPVLGWPLIVLLAIALGGFGAYCLGWVGARTSGGLVLAAVVVMAGVVYAGFPAPIVSGADCSKRTTTLFLPRQQLTSEWPNPVQR